MMNFGFRDLCLVNPCFDDVISEEALAIAKHGRSVLENTLTVCTNVTSAIGDCDLVLATSCRTRNAELDLVRLSELKINRSPTSKVAILFGPENSGLSNEDIGLSNSILWVPTHSECSSLNLSHAVGIVCYALSNLGLGEVEFLKEIQNNSASADKNIEKELDFPNKEVISSFCDFLDKALKSTDFAKDDDRRRVVMRNFKAMIGRKGLTFQEINSLYGIMKALYHNKEVL